MTDTQRREFDAVSYQRMIESRGGHNFEYYDEIKHENMFLKGWKLFDFEKLWHGENLCAPEDTCKTKVKELRSQGNFARIICGYSKDRQRTKYFSVIYKAKKSKIKTIKQ